MGQTYTTIDQATQTGTTVFGHLDTRTDTLRSCFSGTSSPSGPVVGQLWFDTTNNILKVYGDLDGGGASWHQIASDYTTADIDMNDKQLLSARVENLSSDPSASAGTVGRVWLNTTVNRLGIVKTSSTLGWVMTGNPTNYIPIDLPAAAWDRDATNPPTPVTVGTTPTIRGWEFNATNEKASIHVRVPDGFSDDANLKVRIRCALSASETTNDTIDATLDYVVLTPNNNEALTKTSTQATASFDIGSNTAQYALHQFDFSLTHNDATNPIDPGDSIVMEFALSSVASVAGIIFLGAELLVPFGGTILDT